MNPEKRTSSSFIPFITKTRIGSSASFLMCCCLVLGSSWINPATAVPAPASRFKIISPCPFEAAAELPAERLLCGYLQVPENRNKADSALLKLPVAVIRTTNAQPEPDPVIFLAGGPGASPTSSEHSFKLFASHAFGQERDIILFTQRGALMTEPDLRCDELRDTRTSIYAKDQTLQERDEEMARKAAQCLSSLRASGRDLAGYSAVQNAHDLKDLREALGLEQWNLLAVSYGTLMSLEAARLDPSGIRGMVLDSVVSLQSDLFMTEANRNFSQGLGRVLSACRSDPGCHQRFPALDAQLDQVLAELQEQPISITIDAGNGRQQEVIVNWHDFLGLIHWMLYNAKTIPLVPLLIAETADGELHLVTQLMERVFPAPKLAGDSAAGAFFAIVCQDQYNSRSLSPQAEPRYGGYAMASFIQLVCTNPEFDYASSPAPELFRSSIPTLLLSGWFDPVTPDIYAEATASLLDNASVLSIPAYGHSTLSGYTACQTEAAAAFLDDLQPKQDYPCLAELPLIQFVLTADEALQQFAEKENQATEE